MRPRLPMSLVLAAIFSATTACGGGGDTPNGSNTPGTPTSPTGPGTTPPAAQPGTVLATPNNAFSPSTLTVAPGTTVTFTFQSVGHNVFFDVATGAPANIPEILSNTSRTRTFATSGTFGYECHVHSGMRGTVIVQ